MAWSLPLMQKEPKYLQRRLPLRETALPCKTSKHAQEEPK